MGDELGVDGLALDVPDGAGGVDGGGTDAARVGVVPVEGGERAAVVAVAVTVELAAQLDARLRGAVAADGAVVVVGRGGAVVGVVGGRDAPDAQVVGGGGEQVGAERVRVRHEHGLGGRVLVVEGEDGGDVARGLVELDDLDAVGDLLEKAGDGEPVLLIAAHAPVHRVDVPGGLVGVDLRPLRLAAAAAAYTSAAPAVALLLIRPSIAFAGSAHGSAALRRRRRCRCYGRKGVEVDRGRERIWGFLSVEGKRGNETTD